MLSVENISLPDPQTFLRVIYFAARIVSLNQSFCRGHAACTVLVRFRIMTVEFKCCGDLRSDRVANEHPRAFWRKP